MVTLHIYSVTHACVPMQFGAVYKSCYTSVTCRIHDSHHEFTLKNLHYSQARQRKQGGRRSEVPPLYTHAWHDSYLNAWHDSYANAWHDWYLCWTWLKSRVYTIRKRQRQSKERRARNGAHHTCVACHMHMCDIHICVMTQIQVGHHSNQQLTRVWHDSYAVLVPYGTCGTHTCGTYTCGTWLVCVCDMTRITIVYYRVAKTHRIPYLYRSFSAKVTCI